MSRKAKDHRPKIISFYASLSGLNIAAEKSILWPCNAFSISIPEKKKSNLNIFEQTILKLIEIESGNKEKLAKITCLDEELVSFIQKRLNQYQLIDERYNITKEGEELLHSWNDDSTDNTEYITATIFVDLHSGNILPYIHTSSLKFEKIERIDTKNKRVAFSVGSAGKSKTIRAQQISPTNESFWNKKPAPQDIIKAIRAFRINHKKYSLLNSSPIVVPSIPIAEAISVQDKELVYLHCKVIVQKGNPDILVTDGFGFGFSLSFRKHLLKKDWDWLIHLKEQGQEDIHGQENSKNKSVKLFFKYPEISRRLKNAGNSLSKLENKNKQTSSSQEYEQIKQRENVVKNIYAALEWTFRHIVTENPVDDWEQIFSSGNFKDNEKILRNFAKKSGLSLTKLNQHILQVKAGAIRHSKVELQPLLALTLAGANIDSSHPFNFLPKEYPDFLSFLIKLKRLRDPIEHGSIKENNLSNQELKFLLDEASECICILIPEVASDLKKNNSIAKNKKGNIDQRRYKAQVKLDKFFGLSIISNIPPSLTEQLIRSELYLNNISSNNRMELIKCLASSMQLTLFDVIKKQSVPTNSEIIEDLKDSAINKMISIGFVASIEEIPQSITTVRNNMLKNIIQGQSSTLGAHIIALFIFCSDTDLKELKKNTPRFVGLMNELISLRGHGNQSLVQNLSKDKLLIIKDKIFNATKNLLEI